MMFTALLSTLLAAAPSPLTIALPGGPPVSMDYLAVDAKNARVWVPAGNTGRVDVVEQGTGKLTAIEGFETAKLKERQVGPSSATVGDGVVYVGNRANSSVCAIDAQTLEKKGCVVLASLPDGLAFVSTTNEVWVTTPRDNTLTILDVKKPGEPRLSGTLKLESPEGYAVDAARGLFYTNQEDLDRTVVLDVRTRKVLATWKPGCGKEGPRGMALDVQRRHLFVACAAGQVKTLDAGKNGAQLGEVQTGVGLDNIDYLPAQHLVYAAAKAGTLTVIEDAASGALTKQWSADTAVGTRVVVVDASGAAYVADSAGGRLIAFKP